MREDYKKQLSGQIEKHFLDLEQMILEDIVRRIKKAGKITSTADWQINRLQIIGYSSEDIEKMIKTVIRQIKRCLFRQIKTALSEHLTME